MDGSPNRTFQVNELSPIHVRPSIRRCQELRHLRPSPGGARLVNTASAAW